MKRDRWAAVPREPRPPLLDIACFVVLIGVAVVFAVGIASLAVVALAALLGAL